MYRTYNSISTPKMYRSLRLVKFYIKSNRMQRVKRISDWHGRPGNVTNNTPRSNTGRPLKIQVNNIFIEFQTIFPIITTHIFHFHLGNETAYRIFIILATRVNNLYTYRVVLDQHATVLSTKHTD